MIELEVVQQNTSPTVWVLSVISSSYPSFSKMPTSVIGITYDSNNSFCDMINIVKNFGYFCDVIMGPAPDRFLKITLMMCWMIMIFIQNKKPCDPEICGFNYLT